MRCKNHGRAGAPSPSAESIKTERTAGVSPVQFNNICFPALSFPLRSARFQIEGKSVGPNVLSSAMLIIKYFVMFSVSSGTVSHSELTFRHLLVFPSCRTVLLYAAQAFT